MILEFLGSLALIAAAISVYKDSKRNAAVLGVIGTLFSLAFIFSVSENYSSDHSPVIPEPSSIQSTIQPVRVQTPKEIESKQVIHQDYKCQGNCSGDIAGYKWAEENEATRFNDCNGRSNSFNDGCEQYVIDYDESVMEIEDEVKAQNYREY